MTIDRPAAREATGRRLTAGPPLTHTDGNDDRSPALLPTCAATMNRLLLLVLALPLLAAPRRPAPPTAGPRRPARAALVVAPQRLPHLPPARSRTAPTRTTARTTPSAPASRPSAPSCARPASRPTSPPASSPSPTRTATATASPTCSSCSPAPSPARPPTSPPPTDAGRGRKKRWPSCSQSLKRLPLAAVRAGRAPGRARGRATRPGSATRSTPSSPPSTRSAA